MITISQILSAKGHEVWAVHPNTSLGDALTLMSNKDIGAVLVMENDQIVGIFSERDFARQAVSAHGCTLGDPVSKMMTPEVYYLEADKTTEEALALMTEKHFRHLPVLEEGKLAGMITIGDIVKWMLEEKDVTIRGLENYILGRDYNR